ncbi:MAG: Ig-like domain-containing protein [Candidatus Eremiobacteraeota bacterium]|nr:Ig-like domain-containing protein [Candidatus Eremiobacteraeota bacterium]
MLRKVTSLLILFLLFCSPYALGAGIATTLNSVSGPPGWYLVSFPFSSVDSIRGFDGTIYRFEGSAYTKRSSGNTSFIRPGQAFWMHGRQAMSFTVDGELNSSHVVNVRLNAGWNMIGNPYAYYFDWSKALVSYQGVRVEVAQAEARGWLMATLLGYDPVIRSYHKVTPGGRLDPWKGFWMYSAVPCDLILPNPTSGGLAGSIKITVTPDKVPANGREKAMVKVQVLDLSSKPLAYQVVKLATTNGRIAPDKIATDAQGELVTYVTSTTAGSGQVTAQTGRAMGSSSIAFIPAPIDPVATPTTPSGELAMRVVGKLERPFGGAISVRAFEDGVIRIFYGGAGELKSGTSDDGITFREESGTPVTSSDEEGIIASPTVVSLGGGRYRMYYDAYKKDKLAKSNWLYSAISDDGVSWKREGLCFRSATDRDVASTASVVKTKEGKWRLYYCDTSAHTYSAISNDGKQFEAEAGTRVEGVGADVVQLPDGKFYMVYTKPSSAKRKPEIWSATSDDGLTWTVGDKLATNDEEDLHDPAVAVLPNGTIMVYYARVGKDSGWIEIGEVIKK